MENFVHFTQTPVYEQSQGMSFDSSDFTMHVAQTQTVLATPTCATLEEWSEDEEEKTLPEIDPDLEDDDEVVQSDKEEEIEEDDTFEQYLFGEDDE